MYCIIRNEKISKSLTVDFKLLPPRGLPTNSPETTGEGWGLKSKTKPQFSNPLRLDLSEKPSWDHGVGEVIWHPLQVMLIDHLIRFEF